MNIGFPAQEGCITIVCGKERQHAVDEIKAFLLQISEGNKIIEELFPFYQRTLEYLIEDNILHKNKVNIAIFLQICNVIVLNNTNSESIQKSISQCKDQIEFLKSNYSIDTKGCQQFKQQRRVRNSAVCCGIWSKRLVQYQFRQFMNGEQQIGGYKQDEMDGFCIISKLDGSFIANLTNWPSNNESVRSGIGVFKRCNEGLYEGVFLTKDGWGPRGGRHLISTLAPDFIVTGSWSRLCFDAEVQADEQAVGKLEILNRKNNQISEGVWTDEALRYPVALVKGENQHQFLQKQVQYITDKTASVAFKSQIVLSRIRKYYKRVFDMKAKLDPFIKSTILQNQMISYLNPNNCDNSYRNCIFEMYQQIADSIIQDSVHKNMSIQEAMDKIRLLNDNFKIKEMKCPDIDGVFCFAMVFGMIDTNQKIQYQMRVFSSQQYQVGSFGKHGMEGFCTRTFYDDKWIGQFHNNSLNGLAVLTHNSSKIEFIYEGEFKCNTMSGLGRFENFREGWTYTGEWADNSMKGVGRLVKKNGDTYNGEFVLNSFAGKGRYQTQSFTYEGDFLSNYYSVKGIYKNEKDTIIYGEWSENYLIGKGQYIVPTLKNIVGDEYNGEWEQDGYVKSQEQTNKLVLSQHFQPSSESYCVSFKCIRGHGQIKYANNSIYVGDFNHNEIEGIGRYETTEFAYEGEFCQNKYHGRGKYMGVDGTILEGEWASNFFIGKGKYKVPHLCEDCGAEYEGEWWYSQQPQAGGKLQADGKGTIKYPNGNTYSGDFKEDYIDGIGKMQHSSGSKYEGGVDSGGPCGQGRLTTAIKDIYDGEWEQKREKIQLSNKSKIIRDYVYGSGTASFSNGDLFLGQWRGEITDLDRFSFLNVEYKPHGSGRIVQKGEEEVEGVWADGVKVDGGE